MIWHIFKKDLRLLWLFRIAAAIMQFAIVGVCLKLGVFQEQPLSSSLLLLLESMMSFGVAVPIAALVHEHAMESFPSRGGIRFRWRHPVAHLGIRGLRRDYHIDCLRQNNRPGLSDLLRSYKLTHRTESILLPNSGTPARMLERWHAHPGRKPETAIPCPLRILKHRSLKSCNRLRSARSGSGPDVFPFGSSPQELRRKNTAQPMSMCCFEA